MSKRSVRICTTVEKAAESRSSRSERTAIEKEKASAARLSVSDGQGGRRGRDGEEGPTREEGARGDRARHCATPEALVELLDAATRPPRGAVCRNKLFTTHRASESAERLQVPNPDNPWKNRRPRQDVRARVDREGETLLKYEDLDLPLHRPALRQLALEVIVLDDPRRAFDARDGDGRRSHQPIAIDGQNAGIELCRPHRWSQLPNKFPRVTKNHGLPAFNPTSFPNFGYFLANFEKPVLGGIEADFSQVIIV